MMKLTYTCHLPQPAPAEADELAGLAVAALIEEAELTPKPGLVDRSGPGAHADLHIGLMIRSAHSLREGFALMARAACGQAPGRPLRERLAQLGRDAEARMMAATGGINTHRGAIWALGLLTAGAAIAGRRAAPERIAAIAGEIAKYPDRFHPPRESNGSRVRQRFGAAGARGEAEQAFPHVIGAALPALREARRRGVPESLARLDALLAVMSRLDDTCLLHRGGMEALREAQQGAQNILAAGGTSAPEGWFLLQRLAETCVRLRISPGGSADLLAAALFLDSLERMASAPADGLRPTAVPLNH